MVGYLPSRDMIWEKSPKNREARRVEKCSHLFLIFGKPTQRDAFGAACQNPCKDTPPENEHFLNPKMEVRFMISNVFPFQNGWFSGSILIFGGVSIRTSQNSTWKDVNVKCRMSFPTAVGCPEENNRCLSSSFCCFNDLANSFITHRIHVWYIDGVGNKLQNWCVCGVSLKPSPPLILWKNPILH